MTVRLLEEKFCRLCKERKPRSQFRPRAANENWVNAYCIPCDKIYNKKNNDKKESAKETQAKREMWAQGIHRCSKCDRLLPKTKFAVNKQSASGRDWKCKDCHRKAYSAKVYNLPEEEYETILALQGNRCAICRVPPYEQFCIDHDRSCCPKKGSCGLCVRGILCRKCNTLLGLADDNAETLKGAIEYLRMWQLGKTT